MSKEPIPTEQESEGARLTAYALGELNAGEAREVAQLVESSTEARASLREIETTAELLRKEFATEPGLRLREEQLEAITSPEAASDPESKIVRSSNAPWFSGLAVAACAVLFSAIGLKQYLSGLEENDRERSPLEEVADGGEFSEKREANIESDEDRDDAAAGGVARPVVAADEELADGALKTTAANEAPPSLANRDGEPKDRIKRNTEAGAQNTGDGLKKGPAIEGEIADGAVPKPGRMMRQQPGEKERGAKAAKSKEFASKKKPADLSPKAQPSGRAASEPTAPVPTPSPEMRETKNKRALESKKSQSLSKVERGREGGKKETAKQLSESRSKSDNVRRRKESAPAEEKSPATDKAADSVGDGERDSFGGESYAPLIDNPWVETGSDARSTFAIDVDTGTYPNLRRFLTRRATLPPKDSVRIEEMVNYFNYDYPQPQGDATFSVNLEAASCPWAPDHRLVRVGLRGKGLVDNKRPPSNLVFLIDASGSMRSDMKLGLLKRSMKAMVEQLGEDDRIGIVTYASGSAVVLEPTNGDQKDRIRKALDSLKAGGSTNGASGIKRAYELAKANFVEGTNRVILATDGDFNVGATDKGDLVQMVEERAGEHIFLTVLGFGEGNIKEDRMEHLADRGNGSYHYIDSEKEGQKVLVHGLGSTLVTVAKDVMVQVEFDPAAVIQYRLIGYANRMLPDEAFNDPATDAGEIGAGHTATALYEVVPTKPGAARLLTVNVNSKLTEDDQIAPKISVPLDDAGRKWEEASTDFRFAAAVAGFGLLLRDSDFAGLLNYDLVLELGAEGIPEEGAKKGNMDKLGMRREFLDLVGRAKSLSNLKD